MRHFILGQGHVPLPAALALSSTGRTSTRHGLLLLGARAVLLIFQRRFIEGIATTGIT